MSAVFVSTWEDAGGPAVRRAWDVYQQTGCLLTACEEGLVEVEMDPRFHAIGFGGQPNRDGEQELDAGLMDGRTLGIGSVCAMRGVLPAISVARKVLEETPHVMLAGDNALRFAEKHGFEVRSLHSKRSLERYEEWRKDRREAEVVYPEGHDTVTIVGWESAPPSRFRSGENGRAGEGNPGDGNPEDGNPEPPSPGGRGQGEGDSRQSSIANRQSHLVAACSTSGLAWKLPGRVGDSPIAGAGFYADDEAGAAGATGVGEDIWRFMLSFRAVENMRGGMKAMDACEEAVRVMVARRPQTRERINVVFAVSKEGDWGAAASKDGFVAWVCTDGEVESHVIPRMT
ncbi:MAG: isoaspartyl peptidase/L-asparaginase [Armatimonadetes bacterium]|nr:isoaspartyl peptidase/L-asparaginase [Armatimonadota bacterium]